MGTNPIAEKSIPFSRTYEYRRLYRQRIGKQVRYRTGERILTAEERERIGIFRQELSTVPVGQPRLLEMVKFLFTVIERLKSPHLCACGCGQTVKDYATLCAKGHSIRYRKIPLMERFWSKVERRCEDECWPWLGAFLSTSYGQLSQRGGPQKTYLAHRLAYEFTNGPIPHGMYVLHSCDNRRCVNPRHLRLGTAKDNIHDALDRGRCPTGEKNISAKLSGNQIDVIRRMLATGMGHKAISEQFGVSRGHISAIASGKTWKYHKSPIGDASI